MNTVLYKTTNIQNIIKKIQQDAVPSMAGGVE